MTRSDDVTVSVFTQIGGQPCIDQLVEVFYETMDIAPDARDLRAMHAPDLTETRRVLKLYLAEWLGGPQHYSAERGHPRLRQRHMPVAIGAAERDAWMMCMSTALRTCVDDDANRASIHGAMARLADWMRNKPNDMPGQPG